jgi:hypothetical protein
VVKTILLLWPSKVAPAHGALHRHHPNRTQSGLHTKHQRTRGRRTIDLRMKTRAFLNLPSAKPQVSHHQAAHHNHRPLLPTACHVLLCARRQLHHQFVLLPQLSPEQCPVAQAVIGQPPKADPSPGHVSTEAIANSRSTIRLDLGSGSRAHFVIFSRRTLSTTVSSSASRIATGPTITSN